MEEKKAKTIGWKKVSRERDKIIRGKKRGEEMNNRKKRNRNEG